MDDKASQWSKVVAEGLIRTHGLIQGEWTGSTRGSEFPVINPSTGEVLAQVASMGAEETADAIDSAGQALDSWRRLTAGARSEVLQRWAGLVRQFADDLAVLVSIEEGKPVQEARGEVLYAASFLQWFGEEARRAYGEIIPSGAPDTRIIVLKQPVGVAGGITPWNLPAMTVARKVGPALAAGCTMVLKPAEQTPLVALALCELGRRAGLPPGVLNAVVGSTDDAPVIGGEMTTNPLVRKIGFTGSAEVGKLLMSQCASQMKGVSLELGGSAPFIVFDDADLNLAVEGLIASKYRNAGQLCTAANRILVQEGVFEEFAAALVERVRKLEVGHGLDPGIDMGPLIDDAGLSKVQRHVEDLLDHGAVVRLGGKAHPLGRTFYEPTIIQGLTQECLTWEEETFGPVAALASFSSEEEAIQLANDNRSGLVSYVFTTKLDRMWHTSEAIETGMVAINTGRVSNEMAPFGGIKESGLGREGSHYGLDEWLEVKYVNLGHTYASQGDRAT